MKGGTAREHEVDGVGVGDPKTQRLSQRTSLQKTSERMRRSMESKSQEEHQILRPKWMYTFVRRKPNCGGWRMDSLLWCTVSTGQGTGTNMQLTSCSSTSHSFMFPLDGQQSKLINTMNWPRQTWPMVRRGRSHLVPNKYVYVQLQESWKERVGLLLHSSPHGCVND